MPKAEAEWSAGIDTQHSLELNLDVDVGGFLMGKTNNQVIVEISLHEKVVRQKIFQIFAENVVPYIFESHDIFVEGILNSDVDTEWKSAWKIDNDEGIVVRNKVHILLAIQTDRPVTSPQAAYANRGGLASTLTHVVMCALKKNFLGIDSATSEDNISMRNNSVLKYDPRNTSEPRHDN